MHHLKKFFFRLLKTEQNSLKRDCNPSFSGEFARSGLSIEGWVARVRRGGHLYVDIGNEEVNGLKERFPNQAAATVAAADEIMSHTFNLLGSGPCIPIDPDRPVGPNGYRPIDWYMDPVQNLRFPSGVLHSEWDLGTMRPGNADIKLPWELARCQHFVPLGQAYRLTGDEKYAFEIASEIADFMEANPVGIGINWTCAMDVAIRAVNWTLGLGLILRCSKLQEEFWFKAYAALFDHGVFIFDNFENTYEVTSNHYLSNVVGLFYIASLFWELPQGRKWDEYCRYSIEEEITKQVLDDGADFESSVPYHRLVLELFLGAARLAAFRNTPFSQSYHDKLRKMTELLLGVMRPDGLMPVVGDADDGRLHIFTKYGGWNPQDGRHILAPAAMFLGESDWLKYTGEDGLWEAAWWGFDITQIPPANESLPHVVRLFPDAGLAVYRNGGYYLLITNSVVGTKGFGNHKHNDQLSFEYYAEATPLIVDPGSYVYTSDPEARNLFRSTGYHNTVRIDGEEQNEMNPEWLFRLIESPRPEHFYFLEKEAFVAYGGRHFGYHRLSRPVIHERHFRLLKKFGVLLIRDCFHGKGEHHITWHFHLAPGIAVLNAEKGRCILKSNEKYFRVEYPPQLTAAVTRGWYSPSYGVRESCAILDFTVDCRITGDSAWFFAVGPLEFIEKEETREVLNKHRRQMMDGLNSIREELGSLRS